MYKPRYKYADIFNSGNIVTRIKTATKFNAYEFMSLRYGCCEQIAQIDLKLHLNKEFIFPIDYYSTFKCQIDLNEKFDSLTWYRRRELKRKKKQLQSCINILDNWYNFKVNKKN